MAAVFHLAVLEGDVTKVRFLLKYSPGLRVDTVNKLGLTALQQAAIDGNVDMVNFLLEKGADLSCVDEEGRTALHLASQEGHLGVVSLLVGSACANVNSRTKQGYKAIDLAKTDQVRALLSQAMLTESFKMKCSLEEDDIDSAASYCYRNIPGCRNSLSSGSTDSGVYDDSCSSQDSSYEPKYYRTTRMSSLRGYPSRNRHSVISENEDDYETYRRDGHRVRRSDGSSVPSILKSNSFSVKHGGDDNYLRKESVIENARAEMQKFRREQPKAYVRDMRRRRTVTFGLTEKVNETQYADPVMYRESGYQRKQEVNDSPRTVTRPPVPPRVPPRVKSPPVPSPRSSPTPSPRTTPNGQSISSSKVPPRVPPRVSSSPGSTSPVPSPNNSPLRTYPNRPMVPPRARTVSPRSTSLKVRGEVPEDGLCAVPRRTRSDFERGRDQPNRRSCHAAFSSRGAV